MIEVYSICVFLVVINLLDIFLNNFLNLIVFPLCFSHSCITTMDIFVPVYAAQNTTRKLNKIILEKTLKKIQDIKKAC